MTLQEKQLEKIEELSKQGYSKGKIAKELGVSWDTVRKHLEQSGKEDNMNEKKTISGELYSKMFKMFSEGKTAVEAVTELGIPPEEAGHNYEIFKKLLTGATLSSDKILETFEICGGLRQGKCESFENGICNEDWDGIIGLKNRKFNTKKISGQLVMCPTTLFCAICPFFEDIDKDEE